MNTVVLIFSWYSYLGVTVTVLISIRERGFIKKNDLLVIAFLMCITFLLWPLLLRDFIIDLFNWYKNKRQPRYHNSKNLLLILVLCTWYKIAVIPLEEYPGFYRVEFKNDLGFKCGILTDDSTILTPRP